MDATSVVALAEVIRHGIVESVHHGAMVLLDADGAITFAAGAPTVRVLPRSAWKPVQATALLQCGLQVPGDQLAVVCSSHSGRPEHVHRVEAILDGIGLSVADLGNEPDYPFDPELRAIWIANDQGPTALVANCSGKHAGMLATCAVNGWPLENYMDQAHPLQRHILSLTVQVAPNARFAGPDGCGAPAVECSLESLARAAGLVASGSVEEAHRVFQAMTSYPLLAAGPGRIATSMMQTFPGVLVKDGAEGTFVAAAPDGRALALKVADGSTRPVPSLLHWGLLSLGFEPVDLTGGTMSAASAIRSSEVRVLLAN